MSIQFDEIGRRLRAYRLGKGLTATEVAEKIGVSRAAVYRLEKGELVKIETLGKLSELLDVSLPSLLGVGVEYYSNAVAFFERVRQLEDGAMQVLGNFSPISQLLVSNDYLGHLRTMLIEGIPQKAPDRARSIQSFDKVLGILRERREVAQKRHTPVVSVVGVQDLERILRLGLIGRFDLPVREIAKRREAARSEVQRLMDIMERQPIGIQVGVVEGMVPTQNFQVFERPDLSYVTLSPYRLGEHPNLSYGIAIATSAPESIELFKQTLAAQWERSHKGQSGAAILRALLAKTKRVI